MIIVYTVVPAVLGTLAIATGIYLYKRNADIKQTSAVTARSEAHLNDAIDLDNSKKEIMSEFKLGDEEKGYSRNGPSDFYNQMNSHTNFTSMHTTIDVQDPMLNG